MILFCCVFFFFFKQKTAYEMRISDWSSECALPISGGIVFISHEGPGFDAAKAFAHVAKIHDTLLEIFRRADAAKLATSEAADRLAEERFRKPTEKQTAAA